MRNTKRIMILLLVLGVLVFGFPVTGLETISPGSDNATSEIATGNDGVNESINQLKGSHDKHTEAAKVTNGTINQTLSPQVFVVMAAPAFSDSTTSRKIMMVSNTSTLSAGYIETEPVTRLDPASYSNHGWLPSANPVNHPYWHSNITDPYGDGAQWISSRNTTEGGFGDQWRLFKTDFDFPQGATLISAQLWYSPDNTVSVYLNDVEINSTGWVYGPRPDYPNFYSYAYTVNFTPRTGSNTLKFVVRNWETTIYNPTGLLYKVMLEYEPASLMANFTATPTNGTVPLVVEFTDLSTGSPTSWFWDFGDGHTAITQNPSNTYYSAGNYSVKLVASNLLGNTTLIRKGYVLVTGGIVTYYVFADGVSAYHGLDNNPDLPGADKVAKLFYDSMTKGNARCQVYQGTNYCWDERENLANDATGSKYWNKSEIADINGANSAEFAFHVGHGWEDGIVFGTYNNFKNTSRKDLRFSRAKWIVFNSCDVLNQSRSNDWKSVFDGAHLIMGYDTWGIPKTSQGPQFVARMRGDSYQHNNNYPVTPIRYAWRDTLQDTITDSTLKGAYVWADPSQNDYLPGYGTFSEPEIVNGEYNLIWENFIL